MFKKFKSRLGELMRTPVFTLTVWAGFHKRPADYAAALDTLDFWRPDTLTYKVHPGPDGRDYSAQVRRAFDKWNVPENPYKFAQAEEGRALPFIEIYPVLQGAVPGGKIGNCRRTVRPFGIARDGKAVRYTDKAVIHIATDEGPEAFDAVMPHEIGHALGLPHSPNQNDVMSPSTYYDFPTSTDRGTLALLGEYRKGYIHAG